MVKRLFVVLLILVVWMGCWMDADLIGLNEAAFSGDIEKVKSFIVYCPIPVPLENAKILHIRHSQAF